MLWLASVNPAASSDFVSRPFTTAVSRKRCALTCLGRGERNSLCGKVIEKSKVYVARSLLEKRNLS